MISSTAWTNAIAESRNLVQTELASKVPGMSIAVALDGSIVWSEGFGFADLESNVPANSQTRFRIGSVSKPLTAVALVRLVEQGKIDLDAPVQKYLPDFPQKDGVITPRLLAGHLSGIRNYKGNEIFSTHDYPNLRAGLEIFEKDPLIAPPGTRFAYASYNWNTLGAVIEAVTREHFLNYMDEAVLLPLGLTNTVADRLGMADAHRAQMYETMDTGKFIVAPQVNLSFVWPAGGYLSTTEDMARFGAALLQPGFLTADSLRLLFTRQKTADGKPTPYGIGWFVDENVCFHAGDSMGGSSLLLLFPKGKIAVAFACNRGHLAFARNEAGRLRLAKLPENLNFNREAAVARIVKIFAKLRTQASAGKQL